MQRANSLARVGRHADAARWATALFAVSGLLAFASLLAPVSWERDVPLVALLAAGDLAIAALIARRAPERWDVRGLVAVAAAGLAMVFLFALAGAVAPFGYPTFFLLLFAWMGAALPPGYALRFAAPAVLAYALPPIAHGGPAELAASVVVAVPVMVSLAELISAALGRVNDLNVTLSRVARSDDLTGVGNRRRADELLDGITPGDGVIMVDVDHFKLVNDRHGHIAGDRVLAELGALLGRTVRGGDLVARYGGEEFLVIVPSAGGDARTVAERIHSAWRALPGQPTLSLGVAVREPLETAAQTLRRADAAVYAAKRAGRNRVHLATPDAAPPA